MMIETDRMQELNKILEGIEFPDDRIRMIVMGIRDKTDFFHTLTGSVADRVFRRSPVTIVSFRDEKTAGHLRKRLLD